MDENLASDDSACGGDLSSSTCLLGAEERDEMYDAETFAFLSHTTQPEQEVVLASSALSEDPEIVSMEQFSTSVEMPLDDSLRDSGLTAMDESGFQDVQLIGRENLMSSISLMSYDMSGVEPLSTTQPEPAEPSMPPLPLQAVTQVRATLSNDGHQFVDGQALSAKRNPSTRSADGNYDSRNVPVDPFHKEENSDTASHARRRHNSQGPSFSNLMRYLKRISHHEKPHPNDPCAPVDPPADQRPRYGRNRSNSLEGSTEIRSETSCAAVYSIYDKILKEGKQNLFANSNHALVHQVTPAPALAPVLRYEP